GTPSSWCARRSPPAAAAPPTARAPTSACADTGAIHRTHTGEPMTTITLDTARTIIAGARAAAQERGLKPLTVVVLDAGGHVVATEREDGSSSRRFDIAFGKAHGAVALGLGSRALMARAEEQPYFI